MKEFHEWSDFLLTLIAVVLAVLYATGYGGTEKPKKPAKAKRDYESEWRSL